MVPKIVVTNMSQIEKCRERRKQVSYSDTTPVHSFFARSQSLPSTKRHLSFLNIIIILLLQQLSTCQANNCDYRALELPIPPTSLKTLSANTRSLYHFSCLHQTFSNTQQLSVLYERFQNNRLQERQRICDPIHCSQFLIRSNEFKQKRDVRKASKLPDRWHNPQLQQLVHQTRGGGGDATASDDEEYDEDEEYEGEDDSDLFADDDNEFLNNDSAAVAGGNLQNSDFKEGSMVDRMLDAWNNKTPPLTKLYLMSSALVTLYGFLFNKNEFPKPLLLDWSATARYGQIWRPFTSFLNLGPLGLGYIMTFQFIWVYMSTLERLNFYKPYDFWVMILFGQLCMITLYPVCKLNTKLLGHNFSTYLVYIWSRYHEGIEVNMFELFNTRAELMPWFFLGQTYLLEGEIPVLDFLGIVFGHVYHYLYTVGAIQTPGRVRDWYHNSTSTAATYVRDLYKPVSADFDVPPPL